MMSVPAGHFEFKTVYEACRTKVQEHLSGKSIKYPSELQWIEDFADLVSTHWAHKATFKVAWCKTKPVILQVAFTSCQENHSH